MAAAPTLELVAELRVSVGPPLVVGAAPGGGERRIVPILGGVATGPRLAGEILLGGADVQLIRPDGVAEIEARYVLRLRDGDGALVYVVNAGLRHAAPEDMARLARGEPVQPDRVYFRTVPRFETAAPGYGWLHRSIFVGVGERHPEAVVLRIYEA